MPLPNSSAAFIRLHELGRDRLAVWWCRAKVCSVSGVQTHSSSICDGASTKSHSVATPADAGPARVAAEDVVQQVAELVEERLDVGVLHQRRLGARLREVAHQHALRQLRPALPLISVNWAACLYLSSRGCMSR